MAKSVDKNLKKLPLGAIRPEGWIEKEIQSMYSLQKRLGALSGLVKSGEWLNGEFLPRYVRGLVLLAAALDDKNLKDKAYSLLTPIFNSANEGGDFGPKETRSLTPKIEAIKALVTYHEYTGDERILPFLKKFFKNQFNTYAVSPCWFDSRARLLEEIPAIEALYRETDLEWLQDLGERLRDTSNDWFKLSAKFPYKSSYYKYVRPSAAKRTLKKVAAYEPYKLAAKLKPFDHDLVDKEWRKKAHQVLVETDGVNLAKAVKYPAVYGRFIGDDELKHLSLKLVSSLTRYHGTAMGMFACSPRLGAASATDAVDVLAAVEMIESLVEVVKETGDYALMDLLERIVFNVIPSATFDDCSAVQDLVLVNQIEASVQRKLPYAEEDNAFYTKKLTRGSVAVLSAYPLYLQTACMIKNEEINFLTYTPCKMDIRVAGCHMTVTERTGYPFRNTVAFRVDNVDGEPEVKINFRAPKHTTIQLISGGQVVASGTKQISVKCVLKTGSTFMIKMDIPLVAEETRRGCVSLYKGNLLMSEKVPADIKVSAEDRRVFYINFVKRFSVSPILARKASGGVRTLFEPERTVVHEIGERPFSFDVPPFELLIRSKNIANWDYDVNGFAEIPKKPDYSEESLERAYIPVGCTLLRIAEFPKCLK